MKPLTYLTSALFALFVLSCFPVSASDSVKIVVAGPMSGELARFGDQMNAGASIAVAEINATGGVLGKQVELKAIDDRCDPDRGTKSAKAVVATGAVFVAGHFCSGVSIPAADVYADEKLLMISPASSNPRLTDRNSGGLVFRVQGRDDAQGYAAGLHLADSFPGQKFAVVWDDGLYGEIVGGAFVEAIRARQGDLALEKPVDGETRGFGRVIDDLKEEGVTVLFIAMYHEQAASFVKQVRDAGLTMPIYASDALHTEDFVSLAGEASEGVIFTSIVDGRKNPLAKEVVARLVAANSQSEGYALQSYVAVMLWAEAANAAGSTEAEDVAAVLRSRSWNTILGTMNFDEKGDLIAPSFGWYAFQNGQIVYQGP